MIPNVVTEINRFAAEQEPRLYQQAYIEAIQLQDICSRRHLERAKPCILILLRIIVSDNVKQETKE